MTRSFTHHEADSRPEDFGPIEDSNTVEMWDDYEDQEVERALLNEDNIW